MSSKAKKSRMPGWAIALFVLLALLLLVLCCLCLFYGIRSIKRQEKGKKSQPDPQKQLEELRHFAALRSKQLQGKIDGRSKQIRLTEATKKELKKISAMFEESMDRKIDPCDDFHQFACGKLEKTHKRPYARIMDAYKTLQKRKWDALLSIDADTVDPRLHKVYRYLRVMAEDCNSTFAGDDSFLQKVEEVLLKIGGSPILSPNMNQVNPFLSAMTLKALTGVKTLFDIQKGRDMFNLDRTALYVYFDGDFLDPEISLEGTLGYSLTMLNETILNSTYEKYKDEYGEFESDDKGAFSNVLRGYEDRIIKKFSRELDVSIDFEDAQLLAPNITEALLSLTTEEELQDTRIFWQFNYQNVPIPLGEEGLTGLDKLITEYWWSLQSRIVEKFLSLIFDEDGFKESKRSLCSESAKPALNYAVLNLMVNTYDYGPDNQLILRNIIETIKFIFLRNLITLDWIDPITKNKAINKLNRISPRMIAPPVVYDNDALQEYYQDLPDLQGNETLMDMIEAANRMYLKKQFHELADLSQTIFETFMVDMAFLTNAFYYPLENSINILLGFVQPPLLDWDYPNFFIQGVMGFFVGHEITHGFDTTGANFDLNGKYKQWMSEESKTNFQNRSQCFIDQYSKFCYEINKNTSCLNGQLTSGETMADDGGIRFSYLAFKYENFLNQILGGDSDEIPQHMPGFADYTLDQLFFLSFASSMCYVHQKPNFKDPHPPHSARILGTLRNNPFFSLAYNCPEGSAMNPKDKCQVW